MWNSRTRTSKPVSLLSRKLKTKLVLSKFVVIFGHVLYALRSDFQSIINADSTVLNAAYRLRFLFKMKLQYY